MRMTLFAGLAAMMIAATPAIAQQDADTDVDVRAGDTRVQVDADREQERRTTTPRTQTTRTQTTRADRTDEAAPGTRAVAMRVGDLTDLEVRGSGNEEIGNIKDLVVDVESGEIRYAALSVGGVLGVGDKLVAVPWNAFRVQKQDDEWVAIVNAPAAKFENAPGFDDDNWPPFADQDWQTTNDRFYSEQGITTERRERTEEQRSGAEVRRDSGNFRRGGSTDN